MVKLKDVAMKAGVNTSTASRALKNNPEINLKTKQRIIKVAEDMGYFENHEKPVLSKSKVIGIIVPEVINVFSSIVYSIQAELEKKGFCTMIGITNYNSELEKTYFDQFAALSVSGIFYACWENSEYELSKYYDEYRIPIVQLINNSNMFDYVGIDYQWDAQLVIDHLKEKGYRKIGIIGEEHSAIRLNYLIQLARAEDMLISDKYIKISKERFEAGGYNRMLEMLREKERPTAIVAAYDNMAIGAMKAIYDAGLRIPENIAVISFDDTAFSNYQFQPLSTVNTPVFDWAEIAVQTMMDEIFSRITRVKKHIVLKSTLSVRDTT